MIKIRFHNHGLQISVAIVVLTLFVFGCSKKKGQEKVIWRTDIAPIEKRVLLLVPIESCIWQTGQKTDYSGRGLPAPEEYYIRGYIRISTDDKNRILKDYQWQDVQIDLSQINKPDFTSLADVFFTSQDFKQSIDFMRDHGKSSTFSGGKMILSPETNILYFDIFSI